MSVSGPRNGADLWATFLGPEIVIMGQFLGPEIVIMGQHSFWAQKLTLWVSFWAQKWKHFFQFMVHKVLTRILANKKRKKYFEHNLDYERVQ